MNKISLEVPVHYLLQIATHGNLGNGELSDMMKTWAERELIQHGLEEELKKMQIEKLNELHKNLTNVLGKDLMRELDKGIAAARVGIAVAEKVVNLTKEGEK